MTPELSNRQREVLAMLAIGKHAKEAARDMGLEYGTVKMHLERARLKLGARTRPHAVAIAIRAGLI